MKDLVAQLEKLLSDADECDLIANLAVAKDKRDAFRRLAAQYRTMAKSILTTIEQQPKT